MGKRKLILVVVCWCILKLIQYYFLPYFIVVIFWLGLSVGVFLILIIQILKMLKERKALNNFRIIKVAVFGLLFFLTINNTIVNGIIEKADWRFFYKKRIEIVEHVKERKLNPNVNWNRWVCELPFEFPVISNGGNDIGIERNIKGDTLTVTFWVFRSFFNSTSTHFVYTNNKNKIIEFENFIKHDSNRNWKIKENWYRIFTN